MGREMNHEAVARKKHYSGYSCASSVYGAFADVNPHTGTAPAPKSEGGKCGAVLSAEKILREMGFSDTSRFDAEFVRRMGSLKCSDLIRSRHSCNDCVGVAAAIVDSLI